jgi:hypothetical protein
MCLQSSNRPLDGDKVVQNLLKYSKLLAEQGRFSNALTYISATPSVSTPDYTYNFILVLHPVWVEAGTKAIAYY